jgi:hypothetical protein
LIGWFDWLVGLLGLVIGWLVDRSIDLLDGSAVR